MDYVTMLKKVGFVERWVFRKGQVFSKRWVSGSEGYALLVEQTLSLDKNDLSGGTKCEKPMGPDCGKYALTNICICYPMKDNKVRVV